MSNFLFQSKNSCAAYRGAECVHNHQVHAVDQLPQWFCVVAGESTAHRWVSSELKYTKSPTWLWYDLQLKLDLWPPSNHSIGIGIFLGNSFYSEGVLVPISCDHVSVVTGNVLWVALPFYFSVGILDLCFKDNRGPLLCLLRLRFFSKCWNWRGRVDSKWKVTMTLNKRSPKLSWSENTDAGTVSFILRENNMYFPTSHTSSQRKRTSYIGCFSFWTLCDSSSL